MTDIAIRVENLGKRYQIGASKSGSFRESLSHLFRRDTGKRKTEKGKGKREIGKNAPVSVLPSPVSVPDFWALQDINFEIKRGEAVGIIGRNGAGKSTLLKILSRITEPTKGRFEIFGRVSSLLEVGTGFHPELTGRENVYLNGTILGMKRREVKAKFDEIVAFSGVEKFIDTPVKHYSSGMQVRLAFAVAAHLEPEILIIDEVLAVGDAEFQKKCLGKMEDVTGEGRTVLFVSHQMNAVQKLCNLGMLINQGHIESFGTDVNRIISKYFSVGSTTAIGEWVSNSVSQANKYVHIDRFGIYNEQDTSVKNAISNDQNFWIKVEGQLVENEPRLEIGYVVKNEENITVFTSFHYDTEDEKRPKLQQGNFELKSKLPSRLLNEGEYTIELIVGIRKKEWFIAPGKFPIFFTFEIRGGLSDSSIWHTKRPGIIAPVIQWYN